MAFKMKGEVPLCCNDCNMQGSRKCPLFYADAEEYNRWILQEDTRHPKCPITYEEANNGSDN